MKISYRTLTAPFAYGTSYLDHDNWTPPTSVTTSVYGMLSGAATSATRRDIKLQLPVNDGQKGGFDYTLYVANLFDDLTTASAIQTYNFSFETLCSAYQNTVLQEDTLKSYWRKATEKTQLIMRMAGNIPTPLNVFVTPSLTTSLPVGVTLQQAT